MKKRECELYNGFVICYCLLFCQNRCCSITAILTVMDLFKDMKGPTRPAPSVPGVVNRYSPVTNWDNDPFGADVFEPSPHYTQKKKPPPRPPPPKVGLKPLDIPAKPSHFVRKPTVLSSLLTRKTKSSGINQNINTVQQNIIADINSDVDTHKMFPKCEPKNAQTGALIDLSSPPSSPTFTTRSSSDGLSVDSFGSDATTSTNHHNTHNGGNASQAESGFEDDFDLFIHSKRPMSKEDTLDDFTTMADPFSPQPVSNKPALMKKPTLNRDLYTVSNNFSNQPVVPKLKGPTIIRAKPSRPKPPDNMSILKNTFGGSFPVTMMTVNTTTPIKKVTDGFGDSFESKQLSWDDRDSSPERDLSPDREPSPPMPTIPPPPPPADAEEEVAWPSEAADFTTNNFGHGDEEPHAIALFDYFTDHPDDLCFSGLGREGPYIFERSPSYNNDRTSQQANSNIKLIRRVDHEWLYGSLKSGVEGLFPSNYVEVKVPLPNEPTPAPTLLCTAVALYDFEPNQPGDLGFRVGDTIQVRWKINDEWYFGECNGSKGQFPINYVQMS